MATLNDLRNRQTEIRSRLQEIDQEADGQRFTDSQTVEWNDLNEELENIRQHVEELEARQARLEDLTRAGSVESEKRVDYSRGVKKTRVPDDPSDLTAYRAMTSSIDEYNAALKEGALKIVENMVPANPHANREDAQARIDQLVRYTDSTDDPALSRRIIATSGAMYQRAFGKKMKGDYCSPDEERALSLTTTAGGYAVPYTLDPTVILVSTGAINPVRQIADVVTITGNNWIGISSTGITAAYGAEVTETSDNAPTLAQPSANVEKAQAFVPMSIEISEDWASIQSELAMLLGDAKDVLENTQFLTGLGHSSNAPQGLIAVGGATAVVSTATTAVMAVADIYSLEATLNPRFRTRGTFVGSKAAFQKIRQFDTGGGASLWTQLQFGNPADLIGYPAYEWSAFSSAVTTSGSTVMTFGDFSKFKIIDRVGMNLEVIPHLFATANNRPSGSRGLYAYWRNTSYVTTPGLSANSAFVSLKIL
jgi:HK97 family phage major capsid protein